MNRFKAFGRRGPAPLPPSDPPPSEELAVNKDAETDENVKPTQPPLTDEERAKKVELITSYHSWHNSWAGTNGAEIWAQQQKLNETQEDIDSDLDGRKTDPTKIDEVTSAKLAQRQALINPDLAPPPVKFVQKKRCLGLFCGTKPSAVFPDMQKNMTRDPPPPPLPPNTLPPKSITSKSDDKGVTIKGLQSFTLEQHLEDRNRSYKRLRDARKRFGPYSEEYWICLKAHNELQTPRELLMSKKEALSHLKVVHKKYGVESMEYLAVVDEYHSSLIGTTEKPVLRPLNKSLLEPLARVVFSILDKDKDGLWNIEEVTQCLNGVMSMNLDSTSLAKEFYKMEKDYHPKRKNKDRRVHYDGFLSELPKWKNTQRLAEMAYSELDKEYINIYKDTAEDGKVSKEQLRAGFAKFRCPVGSNFEALFKHLDFGGDGSISRGEFKLAFKEYVTFRRLARKYNKQLRRAKVPLPELEPPKPKAAVAL